MPRKPIVVLDTNVFVHAADSDMFGTTHDQARKAQTILFALVSNCNPFLFSDETFQELKWKLREMKENMNFMGYSKLPKLVYQDIIGVRGKKHHFNPEGNPDETEELIPDPSDRKFIYLLRDYPFQGEKYLISEDRQAFFPTDREKRKRLIEYQKKFGFKIISTAHSAELVEFKGIERTQENPTGI